MQVIRCNYCGNREIDPKFSKQNSKYVRKVDKFYCSDDCYYIENVGLNLFSAISYFVLVLPLFPFWIIPLRFAIRGIKLRRKTDYGKRKKLNFVFIVNLKLLKSLKVRAFV